MGESSHKRLKSKIFLPTANQPVEPYDPEFPMAPMFMPFFPGMPPPPPLPAHLMNGQSLKRSHRELLVLTGPPEEDSQGNSNAYSSSPDDIDSPNSPPERTNNYSPHESQTEEEHHSRNDNRQNNKRKRLKDEDRFLYIYPMPVEKNEMGVIDGFFSKWGKIRRINIGIRDDPEISMVEFFNAHDAKEAFHSHEAILNNRFIRIYWGSYGFKRLLEYHTKRCSMVRKGNDNAQKAHKRFVLPPQSSQVSQGFSTFDSPMAPNNSMFNNNNYSSNLKRHSTPKAVATNAPPKPTMPTFLNVPHVEYKKLIAEVKEESTRLSEALENQKKLLGKHQNATSQSAKNAIKDLLKLEMFNIKELKSSIESKHLKLKTAQEFKVNRSVEDSQTPHPKVPSIPCSPSSVTSNHSLDGNSKAPPSPCPTSSTTATNSGIANETSISSVKNQPISDQEDEEDDDDEENYRRSKRHRYESDSESD